MKKIKLILPLTASFIVLICFSVNTQIVAESVKQSLILCYSSVIPSLLPFFILCDFILKLIASIGAPVNTVAFISGLIAGFPTGVKNVCSLYKNGNLKRRDAVSLLHCTANASPAYITAFIGVCIIKNRGMGIILLISQCLTAVICGLFFGSFKKSEKQKGEVINITEAMCFAVSEAVMSILHVCGYIIFFGIIADITESLHLFGALNNEAKATVIGFIEITRGLSLLDSNSPYEIVICAVILAFSGISVIMQCVSCVIKAGLPPRAIVVGKLCYILIMPGIAYTLKLLQNSYSVILFIMFILIAAYIIYNIFDKSKSRIYNR